ncbi:5-oxoprolinase subunit PxpB [Aquimarina sp. I32.4]|uniref:5-oxoprolinase subunit PxpB n=1 Tax=Aquimarina sp. I32.4 TaxID=2053903 RepID=UPI000CDECA03|nr:5-oxoprolinase subunit PxpB [Aquimarina sp. I32.4]
MKYELQYKQYSENAILIQWPQEINENILQDVLSYKKNIVTFYGKLIIEVIHSYNSLLIVYVFTIENIYTTFLELKSLSDITGEFVSDKTRVWKIPVCYSSTLAPDLEVFASKKKLTKREVIHLHTTPVYTIYFIGFLPGFLYLGGLDDVLSTPRKKTPSLHVKKGAVAIGGNQTGIYPMDSPGGWHIIGMCPLNFFDPNNRDCCFASSGDKIQFTVIEEEEYNAISSLVEKGVYAPEYVIL